MSALPPDDDKPEDNSPDDPTIADGSLSHRRWSERLIERYTPRRNEQAPRPTRRRPKMFII